MSGILQGLISSLGNKVISVDYLVIAGGGGGGIDFGAGGGAGGYLKGTNLSLNFGTNYTVTVGAGGVGGNISAGGGGGQTNGQNSVFASITSTGGGRGSSGSGPGKMYRWDETNQLWQLIKE